MTTDSPYGAQDDLQDRRERSEPEPEVDVIVVSYNGAPFLERAIRSVLTSSAARVRAIIIDNGSTDESVSVASGLGATVIALGRNLGYGAALNVGLEHATAEWVACANQDIELEGSTVSALVEAAADYEAATGVPCIAGPRLLTPAGATAETCHELPTLARQVAAFLIGEGLAGARNIRQQLSGPQRCGWVSAVFIVGRRQAFRTVGGFDPRYFMYVEDLDFFKRLASHGYHCLWVPGAIVRHFGGRGKLISPYLYGQTLANWKRYFTSERGAIAGYVALASAVLGCLFRAGLWWCRAWTGNPVARRYARMFSGAAMEAVRLELSAHRE